jgi:hypothetical protein
MSSISARMACRRCGACARKSGTKHRAIVRGRPSMARHRGAKTHRAALTQLNAIIAQCNSSSTQRNATQRKEKQRQQRRQQQLALTSTGSVSAISSWRSAFTLAISSSDRLLWWIWSSCRCCILSWYSRRSSLRAALSCVAWIFSYSSCMC